MAAITVVSGRALPLRGDDLDTDRIMPARFLRAVTFEGLERHVFEDDRASMPEHPFNDAKYAGASILVVNSNFGCGSSREHAPWALEDYGFKAIIAPSFADIFRNNSAKIGLLLVTLRPDEVEILMTRAEEKPDSKLVVDLETQTVGIVGEDWTFHFDIDPFVKHCLLNGLDDIGLTLAHGDAISTFEKQRPAFLPSTVV
jgi:3-isopropylmalate/(R)-2-methylmalate dehydratase small subunit